MGVRTPTCFLPLKLDLLFHHSPRKYIGMLRQDTVFEELSSVLGEVKAHDFHLLKVEPQMKDGGVFVQFQYSAGDPESALETIMHDLHLVAEKQGGMPTWWGAHTGGVWFVKGTPWREVRGMALKWNRPSFFTGSQPLRFPHRENRLRGTRCEGRSTIRTLTGMHSLNAYNIH